MTLYEHPFTAACSPEAPMRETGRGAPVPACVRDDRDCRERVHRLGFGAMRLVGPGLWCEPAGRGPFIELVRRLVEAGVSTSSTPPASTGPTSARSSSAPRHSPSRSTC
jgi:hypothetical protein